MSPLQAHQSRRSYTSDEWITPPEIIKALGPFDLDPCGSIDQPWPCARRMLTVDQDGRMRPWDGVVWLNPPYGKQTGLWLSRLADHGIGIALTFARTETAFFWRYVWQRASGILFVRGRIEFYRPDGTRAGHNSGGPSCLIAYGELCAQRLAGCAIPGKYLPLPAW